MNPEVNYRLNKIPQLVLILGQITQVYIFLSFVKIQFIMSFKRSLPLRGLHYNLYAVLFPTTWPALTETVLSVITVTLS
jgi:hypothetical protein